MAKGDQKHSVESGPRCGCAVGSDPARKLVRPIGLEPITFGSGDKRLPLDVQGAHGPRRAGTPRTFRLSWVVPLEAFGPAAQGRKLSSNCPPGGPPWKTLLRWSPVGALNHWVVW